MKMKAYPLSNVYRLLEPGPVVLVTTSRRGKPNVMTMSWHMMIEFEPPLIGCVISNRNYTFDILKATKECVLSIPTAEFAKTVVGCGNTSGRKLDKFKKFGLTPGEASRVDAPLIEQCYANLECTVEDTALVNKYNIFILKTLKAWINPALKNPRTIHHRGMGIFAVDGKILRLASKMK